jgi:integrase/recombinase XerD
MDNLYSAGMRAALNSPTQSCTTGHRTRGADHPPGQGKKGWVFPIGDRAAAWINECVPEAGRVPRWNRRWTVLLCNTGEPLSPDLLSDLDAGAPSMRRGLARRGPYYLFRHTLPTLMLEGGADVRYIQRRHGHADLKTTRSTRRCPSGN